MNALGKFFVWAQKKAGVFRVLFFLILMALVGANVFLLPHHPHVSLEHYPGFWAAFGFFSAVAMILFVKKFLSDLVGVPEDYYERTDD